MRRDSKTVLCILGPTAGGKTALSLYLAERLGRVEIVSADALAVYRYLDIGTAKPSKEARERIPHHLIDFLDPRERWSAYDFRKEALRLSQDILQRDCLPVVVGGTAFYLHVLLHGIPFQGAPRNPRLRLVLERMRNEQLFALLASVDSYRAKRIGKNDRKRLIRALEIFFLTRRPPSERIKVFREPHSLQYLLVGISRNREELRRRIQERVEVMFHQGLVEEVQHLFALGYRLPLPALENFTYRPVVELLEGRLSEEEAKREIVRGTLVFVKRQMNWFRKMPVFWFSPEEGNLLELSEKMYHFIQAYLGEG